MNRAVGAAILTAVVITVACSASAPVATTASTQTPQPSPTAASTVAASAALSEQPDRAKFAEYLSDAYLGSMPVGKRIGVDGFPAPTTVFHAGSDQLCLMTQVKKSIRAGGVANSVYDAAARVDVQPRMVAPSEWPVGGSGSCGTLPGSAGKYEYKLYIENVVVAVLPFDVR